MSAGGSEIFTMSSSISARLRRDGFVRYRLPAPTASTTHDFQRLRAAFDDLPVDPYAPESNRYRRYSRLVYLPWRDDLSWIPDIPDPVFDTVAEYWQDSFNPEFAGIRRRFAALDNALHDNALLLGLIRANIEHVRWHGEMARSPVYVGVHLIKLSVDTTTKLAVSSPDSLHQDGGSGMFTFAHLVTNENVRGGENVIALPECAGRSPDDVAPADILARFRLVEPLDSYAVHDDRVSHYVSPVRMGNRAATGARGVIIMGIAPMAPQL